VPLERGLEKHVGRPWILGATRRNLATKHRDTPSDGSGVPTLGVEVARAPAEVREAFGRELDALLVSVAEQAGRSKAEAPAQFATWVGALTIARAINDPAQ